MASLSEMMDALLAPIASAAEAGIASGGGIQGGAGITVRPPVKLFEAIERVKTGGALLAQLLVREAADAAIARLEAGRSPGQYGIDDAIAALSGDPYPLDGNDPELGVYLYGLGRLEGDWSVGSAPPRSIATFLEQYRSNRPHTPRRRGVGTVRNPRTRPVKPERPLSKRARAHEATAHLLAGEIQRRKMLQEYHKNKKVDLGRFGGYGKIKRNTQVYTAAEFLLTRPVSAETLTKAHEVMAAPVPGKVERVEARKQQQLKALFLADYRAQNAGGGGELLVHPRSRSVGGRYTGAPQGRIDALHKRAETLLTSGGAISYGLHHLKYKDYAKIVPIMRMSETAHVDGQRLRQFRGVKTHSVDGQTQGPLKLTDALNNDMTRREYRASRVDTRERRFSSSSGAKARNLLGRNMTGSSAYVSPSIAVPRAIKAKARPIVNTSKTSGLHTYFKGPKGGAVTMAFKPEKASAGTVAVQLPRVSKVSVGALQVKHKTITATINPRAPQFFQGHTVSTVGQVVGVHQDVRRYFTKTAPGYASQFTSALTKFYEGDVSTPLRNLIKQYSANTKLFNEGQLPTDVYNAFLDQGLTIHEAGSFQALVEDVHVPVMDQYIKNRGR